MKFALSLKMQEEAGFYFTEARAAYYSWGAFGKAIHIDSLHPNLSKHAPTPLEAHILSHTKSAKQPQKGKSLKKVANVVGSPRLSNSPPNAQNSPAQANAMTTTLDLASVMKACQVLSSEMDLTKLLCSMVKIVMQNTGAQRGFFVVPEASSGKLFVEATGEVGSEVKPERVDIMLFYYYSSFSPPLQALFDWIRYKCSACTCRNYSICAQNKAAHSARRCGGVWKIHV